LSFSAITYVSDEVISERKEAGTARLGDATQAEAAGLCGQAGDQAAWRIEDRKGRNIVTRLLLETLRAAGQLKHWLPTRTRRMWRDWLRRIRHWHEDVFNSWITKDVRVKVPESVRVVIPGKRRANTTAKISS